MVLVLPSCELRVLTQLPNAKEVHIDATSGKILAVQTEKPEDQAEEPAKTHP